MRILYLLDVLTLSTRLRYTLFRAVFLLYEFYFIL